MLQEYITLHVQLGQTQGQILVRKSLLRTKTNSSPSTALLQKRLSPAPIKLLCGPFPCSGGFLRFTVTAVAPSRQAPAWMQHGRSALVF